MIPYCDTPRQSAIFGVIAGVVAGVVSVIANLSFPLMLVIAVSLALTLEGAGHADVIDLGIDNTKSN